MARSARRAWTAGVRNQLWLTGLFLALLGVFMITGSRAFTGWPMYESLLSTLPLYGFLALGLTLVVAAGETAFWWPTWACRPSSPPSGRSFSGAGRSCS